jgi:hypothetical protein
MKTKEKANPDALPSSGGSFLRSDDKLVAQEVTKPAENRASTEPETPAKADNQEQAS